MHVAGELQAPFCQGFSHMASDWLVAVLTAIQKSGL